MVPEAFVWFYVGSETIHNGVGKELLGDIVILMHHSLCSTFIPSVARPKAERSGELGWSKKKMNKKNDDDDYDDYDDDDDDYDQFCTRSNILPFFFQIFTLMFLLFTPKSIYGLYYVPTLCKRYPDEIFCDKKNFFEEKLEFFEKIFFEKKKIQKYFFRKKKIRNFFFFEKIFLNFFFFRKDVF